jgi:hypothetical protein
LREQLLHLLGGQLAILTELAASARAGDVLTTTVTLPDGSTRVLSTTLQPADIVAGSISQLLSQSSLATDGDYSASTTIRVASTLTIAKLIAVSPRSARPNLG